MIAQLVVGVAEAVEGVRGTLLVAEFAVQRDGLLAMGDGVPVVAELGVVPADVVQRLGKPGPVTLRPIES